MADTFLSAVAVRASDSCVLSAVAAPRFTVDHASPPAKPRKKGRPRILALHGSNSNAEATHYQLIILGLNDFEPHNASCEITQLEAQHAGGKFSHQLKEPGRSWDVPNAPLSVSLRYIVEQVKTHGRYDAVRARCSRIRMRMLAPCIDGSLLYCAWRALTIRRTASAKARA